MRKGFFSALISFWCKFLGNFSKFFEYFLNDYVCKQLNCRVYKAVYILRWRIAEVVECELEYYCKG